MKFLELRDMQSILETDRTVVSIVQPNGYPITQLILSVETAEFHPTITSHGCRENIGPFPHISSCVDYCNSIFYRATHVVVRRLQFVLNAAAMQVIQYNTIQLSF